MKAKEIIDLLAAKHSQDVFVSECKDGPSQGQSHLRLDAWAMPRSWSHASVRGYEVKVSRSDFKGDQKWQNYLSLCNQLYFVCPAGLIEPSEMPDAVGLLWVSKTGTRLYEKKKAAFRNVVIPENLYRYVLMCRTVVVRDTYYSRQDVDKATFWREWLARSEADRDLGRAVGGALFKRLRDDVARMEHEVRVANAKMREYDRFRATVTKLGLDPDEFSAWGAERRIRELVDVVPDSLLRTVERARSAIIDLAMNLEALKANSEKTVAAGVAS